MVLGLEPISLVEMDTDKWLSGKDSNNIVLYLQNKSSKIETFLIKRNYLTSNLTPNNRYYECVYSENKQLMIKDTSQKEYYNIGYFFGKVFLITKQMHKKILNNDKTNEFLIVENENSSKFISKNTLDESQIKLIYMNLKFNSIDNTNFAHGAIDLYFEKKMAVALYNYSYRWDSPINKYLIQGNSYFDSKYFQNYKHRYTKLYGSNSADPVYNIKECISRLDSLFLESVDLTEKKGTKLYRGMRIEYPGLKKPGDKIIVKNYSSSSKQLSVAKRFWKKGEKCCLYRLHIDRGIPHIDMKTTSYYKGEKEILLPRNLVFEYLTDTYDNDGVKIREIRVSISSPEQFKRYNSCKKLKTATLKTVTKKFKKLIESGSPKEELATYEQLNQLKVKQLKQLAVNVGANIEFAIEKSDIISNLRGKVYEKTLKMFEEPKSEPKSEPSINKCNNRNPAPPCKPGKYAKTRKLSNGKTEKCCYVIKKKKTKKCTNRNPAPPCKNGKIIGNRKLSNGKTEKCCYNPNYLKYIKKNN